MSKSPTQRSMEEMRKRGYYVEKVEHYVHWAKRTKDLFGFIDIICLGENEIIGVQTTTSNHLADRIKKIADHENVAAVRKAGIKILAHGWDGAKLREVDCS